jgi:hypothetical protein
MRRRLVAVPLMGAALAAFVAFAPTSCSVDFDVTPCGPLADGAKDPCALLTPADPCKQYECDPRTNHCAARPLDHDHDGVSPASCGGCDCNDGDPTVHCGATEACNYRDDDCNGVVDDGFSYGVPSGSDTTPQAAAGTLAPYTPYPYSTLLTRAKAGGVTPVTLVDYDGGQSAVVWNDVNLVELGSITGPGPRPYFSHPAATNVEGSTHHFPGVLSVLEGSPEQLVYAWHGASPVLLPSATGVSLPAMAAFPGNAVGVMLAVYYEAPGGLDATPDFGCGAAPATANVGFAAIDGADTSTPSFRAASAPLASGAMVVARPALAPLTLDLPGGGIAGILVAVALPTEVDVLWVTPDLGFSKVAGLQTSDAVAATIAVTPDGKHVAVLVSTCGSPPQVWGAFGAVTGTANAPPTLQLGSFARLATVNEASTDPSIVWITGASEWLVAWMTDAYGILGKRVAADGSTPFPSFTISQQAFQAVPFDGPNVVDAGVGHAVVTAVQDSQSHEVSYVHYAIGCTSP